MVSIGNFFFRYRDFIFPVVFLAMAAGFRPYLPSWDESADIYLDAAGFLVALLGQALRAAVIGYAYIKRGGKNKKVYADSLVQAGFFAHSRNPLYVGNLLVLFGLIIIHSSPWFYLFGFGFYLFAYVCLVLAEENYLRGKFGEAYDDYCRKVNRFLPSFSGLGKSLDGMKFDWKKVIRKEYGSTFSWVTCALALLVWERWSSFGYEAREIQIHLIFAAWVPVVLAYAVARVLKKTGRLGAG